MPAVMRDPSLGEHTFVYANGIRFHAVVKGDASLPLMLCLHGFPESFYTWRHQLRAFSGTHRVVAVDLRGYGETARSEPCFAARDDYSMPRLCEDVRALIVALGHSRCTLVAHDWGGVIAWAFAYAHPECLTNLVVMNAPHPKAYTRTLSCAQFMRSLYVFMFQVPALPEAWIRAVGVEAFIRRIMLEGEGRVRRGDTPAALRLGEDDVEAFAWSMSRAGTLTASLNYYRNLLSATNARFARESGLRSGAPKLAVRTLLLWGEHDFALGCESPLVTGDYVQDLEVQIIRGASHWVNQDAVVDVLAHVGQFLGVSPVLPAAAEAAGGAAAASAAAPSPAAAGGKKQLTAAAAAAMNAAAAAVSASLAPKTGTPVKVE